MLLQIYRPSIALSTILPHRMRPMEFSHAPWWRAMSAADLPDVQTIADAVHTAHPERPAVFAERLRLHAAGCLVLTDAAGTVSGYSLGHPWDGPPPALDTLLRALPPAPTTFYIHDIALLPAARRRRAAADVIARLVDHARGMRLPSLSLVAVEGTAAVWQRLGFRPHPQAYAEKLSSYGAGSVHMIRSL
jgi:ribosomal protein S18 acetylase RimI-like enzyme